MEHNVNVDVITRNGVNGEVAQMLSANGQLAPERMRPFYDPKTGKSYISVFTGTDPSNPKHYKLIVHDGGATLERFEWVALDRALQQISTIRLGGVADLVANGLVYNLGNAMGTTVLEWHDVSDALEAELTMDGISRGKNDRVVYTHNYLPIPIIHADYEINARVLAASRALGNPLDTTMVERAGRKVLVKLEQMLFTDTKYSFGAKDSKGRNTIFSYINYPDRLPVPLTVAWDESGKTPAQIVEDVRKMKQKSIDAWHYGPWMLYIPTAYETIIDEDYSVTGANNMTIRERILKISGIKGIKVIDTLPANNVLLVQMTSDVVRLVRGLPIQNIQWQTEGKFVNHFKVITIQVPQIRSDQSGKTGIVHLA